MEEREGENQRQDNKNTCRSNNLTIRLHYLAHPQKSISHNREYGTLHRFWQDPLFAKIFRTMRRGTNSEETATDAIKGKIQKKGSQRKSSLERRKKQ